MFYVDCTAGVATLPAGDVRMVDNRCNHHVCDAVSGRCRLPGQKTLAPSSPSIAGLQQQQPTISQPCSHVVGVSGDCNSFTELNCFCMIPAKSGNSPGGLVTGSGSGIYISHTKFSIAATASTGLTVSSILVQW